jgi:glucose/arabinose dehydrogenase
MRFSVLCLLVVASFVPIATGQVVDTIRVAQGLAQPLYAGSPPGDHERLFILEQWTARIRILKNGVLLTTPFLDINPLVIGSGNERGLLGMAFHPNYAQNGRFFVHYSDNSGTSVIARYTRSATNHDLADPGSGVIILSQAQPFTNHNGGGLAFGPDGYLYIAFGDGGSAGDPNNNAQNLNTWLGKMLRIDVDNPAPPLNYSSPPSNPFYGPTPGLDEIWAYGLRNPFRFSFDRVTGEMYIGDVGQNAREEISYQPALDPANPSLVAGRNYGWRCKEGTAAYNSTGCPTTGLIDPIYDYAQGSSTGWCVTGGYVYRGCAIPALYGHYVFADYQGNRIWSFRYANGSIQNFVDRTADLAPGGGLSISLITSFGEDAAGEIYIVKRGSTSTATGEIYKIVPAASVPALPSLAMTTPLAVGATGVLTLTSASDPNEPYLAAFSLSTLPPIILPDLRTIPIAHDFLLELSLTPGNGIFLGTAGNLDTNGQAQLQIVVPPSPALAGLRIYGAAVILQPTAPAGVEGISCALPITIQ